MQPGIFEFQSMITSVVNGISGSLLTSVQSVAYVLMTICLVLGIYEAYVKGGDVRITGDDVSEVCRRSVRDRLLVELFLRSLHRISIKLPTLSTVVMALDDLADELVECATTRLSGQARLRLHLHVRFRGLRLHY